jgi:hypothetical protein
MDVAPSANTVTEVPQPFTGARQPDAANESVAPGPRHAAFDEIVTTGGGGV